MRIFVRYFAVVRERLRSEGESLDVPEGADVARALDLLLERHEVLRPMRKHLQIAVNQETVPPAHGLAEGDELALIPPVAGGGGRLARVVGERAPSLDSVVAAVRGEAIGGI